MKPGEPWIELQGFRLNAAPAAATRLFLDGRAIEVPLAAHPSRSVHVLDDEAAVVFEGGEAFVFRDHPPAADASGSAGDGQVRSPMPGKVTQLSVAAGDAVTGLNQIAVAMAQAEVAAVDIHNALRREEGRTLCA